MLLLNQLIILLTLKKDTWNEILLMRSEAVISIVESFPRPNRSALEMDVDPFAK